MSTPRKQKGRASLKADGISRARLAGEVRRQMKRFGLTQSLTAKMVDDAATQINRLDNGHVWEFSADRLAHFLLKLGSDIEVTIRHAKRLGKRGKVRFVVK